MFKVIEKRRVEWPVSIQVPHDGGRVREHEVTVEYEDLAQDEQDEIYANGGNDVDLMKRVVTGWKSGQFKDAADNDIDFTPENLAMLLRIAYVRKSLIAAYLQLHHGQAAARKN